MTPGARPARVEMRLRDGRVLARQVDQPLGEFDRPYPESLLREKFVALAGPDLEGPAADPPGSSAAARASSRAPAT